MRELSIVQIGSAFNSTDNQIENGCDAFSDWKRMF